MRICAAHDPSPSTACAQVGDDSKETLFALFILLVFALVASGYVFKKGLEKGDRTTHELLLRCVIIITSVVPRSLPMQTAMAVNTALLALMRSGVFCTEPYRVPFAGKIDCILFDKTGTLTTDRLVPVGIVNCIPGKPPVQKPVSEASTAAATVLAGCHSLIAIADEGELLGDPIETAALSGVQWRYDPKRQTAYPGDTTLLDKQLTSLRAKLYPPAPADGAPPAAPLATGEANKLKDEIVELEKKIGAIKSAGASCEVKSVRIVHRHHFSSALQRMSTIAIVERTGGSTQVACLVKVRSPPCGMSSLRLRRIHQLHCMIPQVCSRIRLAG